MRIAMQSAASFIVVTAMLLAANFASAQQPPEQVVQSATQGIIDELKRLPVEDRTEEQVRHLVMTYITPAIDQQRIAMGALGKHWRRADNQQRERFIELFRDLQIRTYAGAFKSFSGEQITLAQTRFNQRGDRALVKGQLVQSNGQNVPLDFRLYQTRDNQWRVYDAVVAGLSMVKTYRSQLSEQLQSMSMDELLAQMEQQAPSAQQAQR
jgi:ABC-type transporter MlaC component